MDALLLTKLWVLMGEPLSGLVEGGKPANFTLLLKRAGPFKGIVVLSLSDLHTKVVPNIKPSLFFNFRNDIKGKGTFFLKQLYCNFHIFPLSNASVEI